LFFIGNAWLAATGAAAFFTIIPSFDSARRDCEYEWQPGEGNPARAAQF